MAKTDKDLPTGAGNCALIVTGGRLIPPSSSSSFPPSGDALLPPTPWTVFNWGVRAVLLLDNVPLLLDEEDVWFFGESEWAVDGTADNNSSFTNGDDDMPASVEFSDETIVTEGVIGMGVVEEAAVFCKLQK